MKIKANPFLPLLLLVLFFTNLASSQTLPDTTIAKINQLFKRWDNSASPGCAVGIIRNDSLIFAKGYGLANLEYSIPIMPSTPFHMASISKQFTAYSIVLLARQGKLKLDDDVRKYLPWFPNLGTTITIRHLLNHTSGVRDQWQLLAIAGTRLDDVITQDQVVKILSNQQALNFKPGEQYMYSNSGFTMLAEIVKSVTGQTLRQFTDSAIFKPLGMAHTHFHDDYEEIVKNRSYSYDRVDSTHFSNAVLSYSVAGATSLFTTIEDLSKWVMNFYHPVAGDTKDIEQLTQNGKLNSGKQISYALGIVNDTYHGWIEFTHNGADAGYRTYMCVFPDAKMGFLVFSNLADVNPGRLGHQIADLFIKDTVKKNEYEEDKDIMPVHVKNIRAVKKYIGHYITEDAIKLTIELRYNSILYSFAGNDTGMLLQIHGDTFAIAQDPASKFIFSIKGRDTFLTTSNASKVFHAVKYVKDTAQDDKLLQQYTGTYYCPELDCRYGIKLKDHHLFLTNAKYNDAKLTLEGTEHLFSDYWWMDHLFIIRNSAGKITGFEVNGGRVMHLRFNRMYPGGR